MGFFWVLRVEIKIQWSFYEFVVLLNEEFAPSNFHVFYDSQWFSMVNPPNVEQKSILQALKWIKHVIQATETRHKKTLIVNQLMFFQVPEPPKTKIQSHRIHY